LRAALGNVSNGTGLEANIRIGDKHAANGGVKNYKRWARTQIALWGLQKKYISKASSLDSALGAVGR